MGKALLAVVTLLVTLQVLQLVSGDDKKGNYVTILSIDRGGIKGLIHSPILAFLESELQKLDGGSARIANYFDVITGTSTGGLMTAMHTAPNSTTGLPLYEAKDMAAGFYMEHGPSFFPPGTPESTGYLTGTGPKYNGTYLRNIIRSTLGNLTMKQALTEALLPTFELKDFQPVLFSTRDAKEDASKDALLSDVCIASSAIPTFLPPHYFNTTVNGKTRHFDLIDGGGVGINPTLMAITHMSNQIRTGKFKKVDMKTIDGRKMLVLSLGCCVQTNANNNYNAAQASGWGAVDWISLPAIQRKPILEINFNGNADMVDIHVATIFKSVDSESNFLRIQSDTLTGDAAKLDVTTPENMHNLVQIGTNLLSKTVARLNLETGRYEEVPGEGTNAEALIRFAYLLSQERKRRVDHD